MFCYNSGTTGDPKADILSHRNLMSCAASVLSVGGIVLDEDDTVISYLPLANSFEKILWSSPGVAIGDILKLLDDLKEL